MPQEFGLGALEGVGHFQTFFFGSVIFRLYLVVWDGGLEVEIGGFLEILSSFCVGSAFCYGSLGFCVCQERHRCAEGAGVMGQTSKAYQDRWDR